MMNRLRTRAAKTMLLFLCVFSMLTLSGCWDRIEVNDLALVLAVAIDKKDEKYLELSAQIFTPQTGGGGQLGMSTTGAGGAGGGKKTMVRSGVGVTISDAMSNLQEELPRKVFWGHTEVFVIGEKLAKEGIRDQVDFILRYPQTRERSNIFVSSGGARKALEALPPLERASSEVLREMTKTKLGINVTASDLGQMLSGGAQAAVLPWVEMLPSERSDRVNKATIPYIKGAAVFKKGKMTGRIDEKVTRGVLWLRNEMKRGITTVSPDGEDGGYVSLSMLRSTTKLTPSIQGDQWSMAVKIETEESIIQNTTKLDIMKKEVSDRLEKLVEAEIKNRVNQALAKGQKELNTDIFNFYEVFHRQYPKQWSRLKEQWDEKFPEIEVHVEAHVKIRRTGMITSGGSLPREELKKK